jgi:hypothetical protein
MPSSPERHTHTAHPHQHTQHVMPDGTVMEGGLHEHARHDPQHCDHAAPHHGHHRDTPPVL